MFLPIIDIEIKRLIINKSFLLSASVKLKGIIYKNFSNIVVVKSLFSFS